MQDYDCGPMGCVPSHPAVEKFSRLFFALVEAAGRDPRRGAVLPAIGVEAGLGEPEGMDGFVQVTPAGPFAAQRADALASVLPACIGAGLLDEAQGRALLHRLRDLPDGGFRTGISPLLVGTWWRRADDWPPGRP